MALGKKMSAVYSVGFYGSASRIILVYFSITFPMALKTQEVRFGQSVALLPIYRNLYDNSKPICKNMKCLHVSVSTSLAKSAEYERTKL